MKTRNQITVFLLLMLFVSMSCNSSRTSTEKKQKNNVRPITTTTIAYDEIASDPFGIDTVYMQKKTMVVAINYGGGCGTYEAALYYNGIAALSMPPQLSMKLAFIDNDRCRANIHDTLYFDMSEIDPVARSGAIIRLQNYDHAIKYNIPTP